MISYRNTSAELPVYLLSIMFKARWNVTIAFMIPKGICWNRCVLEWAVKVVLSMSFPSLGSNSTPRCRPTMKTLLCFHGVVTFIYSGQGVFVTDSDRIELPIVYVHTIRPVVLRHNNNRQSPLRVRKRRDIAYAQALDLVSQDFRTIWHGPVPTLRDRLHSRLKASLMLSNVNLSKMSILHVVNFFREAPQALSMSLRNVR